MKIASWNVNSIKARLDHALQWLQDTAPDALMLQELKGETFPSEAFEAIGYHASYVGQKAYNGVAILTKTPHEPLCRALPGNADDVQARYIETDLNGIRLINIYLPNGNPLGTEKFDYKLAWMDRLYTQLKSYRDSQIPFMIGGDFNIIPDNIDCYDPAAWANDALFAPESRARWRALLNLGLTDCFRALHPQLQEFSFWDYQAGAWQRNNGIRIDHFLASPAIADRVTSCVIDKTPRGWDKASDHTPIVVEIA